MTKLDFESLEGVRIEGVSKDMKDVVDEVMIDPDKLLELEDDDKRVEVLTFVLARIWGDDEAKARTVDNGEWSGRLAGVMDQLKIVPKSD